MEEDRDWERLRAAFLRRPSPPSAAETERFVSRVMAGLPDAAPAPEERAWLDARWLAPALAFAAAALSLSFALPPGEDEPSTALLVAAAGAGPAADWAARPAERGALEALSPEER